MSEDSSLNVTFKEVSKPAKQRPLRSLEIIEADIHAVHRQTIFRLGKLLTEAKRICHDRTWKAWLDKEFVMSEERAADYMAAWRMVARLRTARSLNVATRVICAAALLDKANQDRAVAVLAKATSNKRLSATEGYKLLELVRREAFQRAAKEALRLSRFTGPVDKTMATATRQAALAWTRLAANHEPDDDSSNPLVAWWETATANQRAEFVRYVREIPKPITRTTNVRRKLPHRQRNAVRKRARR